MSPLHFRVGVRWPYLSFGSLGLMSAKWTPITSAELQREIDTGVGKMSPSEKALWRFIHITPQKWKLSPWGDEGGGFWVAAIYGTACIYYNDIEDGFNVSPFTQYGAIADYWCSHDELQWVIHRMVEEIYAT